MGWILGVAVASLLAWIALVAFWGGFWLPRPKLLVSGDGGDPDPAEEWPSVVAVIPARNEEDMLGQTLPTVINQSYDGPLHVVLVDDRSEDGTTDAAHAAAEKSLYPDRLTVVEGQPLPDEWAGKVWAMHQGVTVSSGAEFLWLTDADIAHGAKTLSLLVQKARQDDLDLVSVMARLRVESGWDHLLIPAFVYFFAKLYPFRFVNDPRRRAAGAAGGCILLRAAALHDSGGLQAIRSALIDDCALARMIKAQRRRIWLGLSDAVESVRPYRTLRSVWDMVARSAFHQLDYSVLKLVGTLLGMVLLYVAPPMTTILGLVWCAVDPKALWLTGVGGATWVLSALSFMPMLRHQGASLWMAPWLPLAGFLYTGMTMSSAFRHVTGRSGMWKGRPFAGGRVDG